MTIIYFHVILLDFPITYRNASVLCQSECTCLHQTVDMVVFFWKMMKTPTQKGDQSYTFTKLSLYKKYRIDTRASVLAGSDDSYDKQ